MFPSLPFSRSKVKKHILRRGLKNNKYVLSHTVSAGQEFESSLARWFCLGISDEVAIKTSARTAVIGRLAWDWKILMYDGSLTWILTEGLISSPRGPQHSIILQGLAEVRLARVGLVG